MTSDDRLIAWREAYLAGGLPLPSRADRWQVLRAGVAGLWEFEATEYWYANGWCQLTGRNETGKSSLMALTTLIPWLADVSPNNIDTLGASTRGKNFRYYVEPTTADGDRRQAETTTNHGWLWVEYGRLTDEAAEYFTTLGYFRTQRANQSTYRRDWVTVEGTDRVRRGITLVTERSVHAPKDVAKTAAGVRVHSSGTEYRQQVANRLLGSDVDGLESIGKLLRVIRTPKLGQSLSESFVTDKLRDSLPGLDPSEVSKLAAGWDELDKVRLEMDVASAAVDALGKYLRLTWRPYLGAELRQSADHADDARIRFERVARTVRSATQKRDSAQTSLNQVDEQQRQVDAQLAAETESVGRLRASSEYLDASQRVAEVKRTEAELETATAQHKQAENRLAQQTARATEAERVTAETVTTHAEAETTLASDARALQQELDDVGLTGRETAVHDHDTALLDRLLRDRTTQLDHLGKLFATHDKDDAAAQRLELTAEHAATRAADSTSEAETAWQSADSEREGLVLRVSGWVGGLPATAPLPEGLLDEMIAALPDRAGHDRTRLADLVRTDWYLSHRPVVDEELHRNRRQLRDNDTARVQLEAESTQLRDAVDPVVSPPVRLLRRDRPTPTADAAPLWRLLDAGAATPTDLAAIEAGLTAMGLLDAWVSADGVYRPHRDGNDTVLSGAEFRPVEGRSLADLLAPVDGSPGIVRQLLASIGWGDAGAAYWIAGDGTWRTPRRAGRAELTSGDAELIGETARRRARQRRLAEIETELAELARLRTELDAEREILTTRAAQLEVLLKDLPSDDRLRALLAVATAADERADRDRASAEKAREVAVAARAVADQSRATALDYGAQYNLPRSSEARSDLHKKLLAAVRTMDRFKTALQNLSKAWQRLQEAQAGLVREQQQLAVEVESTRQAEEQVGTLKFTLEQLRAQLDSDAASILRQVDTLKDTIRTRRRSLDDLRTQARQLEGALATAANDLHHAEESRQEREAERDAAYSDFHELLELGVPDELNLELPQPEARTIEATSSQVTAVIAQVAPRNWPPDNPSQARHVQNLRDRLNNLDDLRTLEAGGRTVSLNRSGRLPRLEVVVDATGTAHPARVAMQRLEAVRDELQTNYDSTIRRNLEELLGSTFIDHLRRQLATAYTLVHEINDVLKRHPTGTTRTMLRIDLSPVEDYGAMLQALRGSASLLNPETAERVREFLRTRIEGAREASLNDGEVEWGERLAEALDYRRWWDVRLQMRAGETGRWNRVDAARFALQSGGARVVLLMLPLVATLSALYRSRPSAPHPFWLDEAFDGLDQTNRQMVLELLAEFDFDVLLAGPGRLLNSPAVPAAAMYQVVRADHPYPGADLTCELWAGGELIPLQPDDLAADDDTDSLFGVEL